MKSDCVSKCRNAPLILQATYQNAIQRPWLERVIHSNAVSIPLDTIIFNCMAFGGIFSNIEMVSIIFGETITKAIIGGIVAFWKVKEKETSQS